MKKIIVIGLLLVAMMMALVGCETHEVSKVTRMMNGEVEVEYYMDGVLVSKGENVFNLGNLG